MKITFWLRNTDKKYWDILKKQFKSSEILSRGIELVYLEQIEKVIKYDNRKEVQTLRENIHSKELLA